MVVLLIILDIENTFNNYCTFESTFDNENYEDIKKIRPLVTKVVNESDKRLKYEQKLVYYINYRQKLIIH